MLNVGFNRVLSSQAIAFCAVVAVFTYVKVSASVQGAVSLPAEVGAWCTIWLFAKLGHRLAGSSGVDIEGKPIRSHGLAVCIVLAFACEQAAPVELTGPLLAPLLLMASHLGRYNDYYRLKSSKMIIGTVAKSPDAIFIVSSVLASVALLHTADCELSILTATTYLGLLVLIFGNAFGPGDLHGDSSPSSSSIERISFRVVALLGICMCIAPPQVLPSPSGLGLGVLTRAIFWILLLELAVTAASVYGLGVQMAYIQRATSFNGAVLIFLMSLFILWHPRSGFRTPTGSTVSAILSALAFLCLFLNQYPPITAVVSLEMSSEHFYSIENLQQHPIAKLVEEATLKAAALEFNQSITLGQAIHRYHQDFKQAPPPNFDAWFAYAQQHDALVDNYQAITRSIHALHKFTPADLRRAVKEAGENEDSNSVLVSIKNGIITANRVPDHFMTTGVMHWLEHPLPKCVPDADFILNLLDEPRILIAQRKNRRKKSAVEFLNLSGQSLAAVAQDACALKVSSRPAARIESPNSWFIRNMTAATDACHDPSIFSLHGVFQSPDTAKITRHALPIFSPAGTSPFSDILIPSPWYQLMSDMNDYNAKDDMAWTKKDDLLHWSGRSTGGHATSDNWRHLHRQRFVDEVNNATKQVHIMSQTGSGLPSAHSKEGNNDNGKQVNQAWEWVTSTLGSAGLPHYFDVRLTGDPVQCEAEACDEERSHFHMADLAPMNAAYKAKLVIDIDGNSFSGRFHRLLTSQSTVLKQTIFQEWHEDRLVPWAHYIPVSMHMKELPEMVRFFLDTEEGQGLALKIARQGSRWAKLALRPVDLKVAFYRVLVEYAWLMSDERVPPS